MAGSASNFLVDVFSRVKELLDQDELLLTWDRFPDKNQRIALAELALMIAHARREGTGIHTKKQVAWAWSILSQNRTLSSFLHWFANTFFEGNPVRGIDEAFRFLQACEFGFPRSLAAIEDLVRHARPDLEPSYGVYISSIENWFRPAWMKQLDEAGIPLPLAERLRPYLGDPADRRQALSAIHALEIDELNEISVVDRLIIETSATHRPRD